MTVVEEYISTCRDAWPLLDETDLRRLLADFQMFARARATRHSRDAIEAARRAGFWCGGPAPFGYRLEGRLLVPDPPADGTVRLIFDLFLRHGYSRPVVEELSRRGICRLADGKSRHWRSTHLYAVLRNPVYAGEIPLSGSSSRMAKNDLSADLPASRTIRAEQGPRAPPRKNAQYVAPLIARKTMRPGPD